MKKFLLLLFVPISLFAQFEDDYYVITNENQQNAQTYLIDYKISTNTLNNEILLIPEEGTSFLTENGILLTYVPNQPFLLGGFLIHEFSEEPSGSFNVNKFNNLGIVDAELGGIGGYGSIGSSGMSSGIDILGITGIHGFEEHVEIYSYSSFYNEENPLQNSRFINKIKFIQNEFGNYEIEGEDIIDLTDISYTKGLAYDEQAKNLYFIGKNSQNEINFYQFSINENQLSELNSNFGTAPCCNYTMHFMRGHNKIMMADFESGDFYIYDLNTHLVELYAETDLQFVTGIVNKHDFLGNVEVYNQGEIKIYPNPVKENLHIETNSQIERIELFNIIGQKLEEFNSNSKALNLSKQSKGIYILQIQLKNGKIETKKIIKK